MQDGRWNQSLPLSLLMKDGGRVLEGDGGVFSETSSDGDLYLDSMADMDAGVGEFSDLTAFLSQDEINRSLDLAREAFSDAEDRGVTVSPIPRTQEPALYFPSPTPFNTTEYLTKSTSFPHQTKAHSPDDSHSVKVTSSQSFHLSRPIQATCEAMALPEKFVCHKNITPVYKQDKPRLVHEGLELNERAASATEFCSRAATFIEELSSIFKGSARPEHMGEEDSSSPDSGYLSPKSHWPAPQGSASVPPQPLIQQGAPQQCEPGLGIQLASMMGGMGVKGVPPLSVTGVPIVSNLMSVNELMGKQQHSGAPLMGKQQHSGAQLMGKQQHSGAQLMGKQQHSGAQLMGEQQHSEAQLMGEQQHSEAQLMGKQQHSGAQLMGKQQHSGAQLMGKQQHSGAQLMGEQQHSEAQLMGEQQHSGAMLMGKQQHSGAQLMGEQQHSGAMLMGKQQHSGAQLMGEQQHSEAQLMGEQQHSGAMLMGKQQHSGAQLMGEQQHSGAMLMRKQQHSGAQLMGKQQHSEAQLMGKQQHSGAQLMGEQQHSGAQLMGEQQHSESQLMGEQQHSGTQLLGKQQHSGAQLMGKQQHSGTQLLGKQQHSGAQLMGEQQHSGAKLMGEQQHSGAQLMGEQQHSGAKLMGEQQHSGAQLMGEKLSGAQLMGEQQHSGAQLMGEKLSGAQLMGEKLSGAQSVDGDLSLPHFTQKLKSQEVAEGHPIRLECRVAGIPQPLVRWFCEGRELHHCPDIQIWRDGALHTLVIAEAFEDDTGRYTCVASNSLGADNTSAEVYIQGASSSDSEGEVSKSRSGAMPQVQKKTTSISVSIRSPSPKSPEAVPHRSTLVLSAPPHRMQSPVSSLYGGGGPLTAPPIFTKLLQNAQASEGQVVVLECRVRGSFPLQVQWFRQGQVIQDSPDFRILQKKPRSAAEPEEICTLVIAEAFPEDGGQFCCIATNLYGSVSSTAQLSVTGGAFNTPTAVYDSFRNGVAPGDDSVFEDTQAFPPPPPTEISLLEVPPKVPPSTCTEGFHVNELEIWPSMSGLQPVHMYHDVEGQDRANWALQNGRPASPPQPTFSLLPREAQPDLPGPAKMSPPPVKEGPPLPTKPKLNAEQLKQLQDQIILEQQEAANWIQHQEQEQEVPPLPQQPPEVPSLPSPPLPPPPSFQELESSAMQTSTFNYARPKQFIAAQSPGGTGPMGGYVTQSSGSSGSSLPSPLSPPTSQKPFTRVVLPPFSKGGSIESQSPSSPSFPPPPPPFLSSSISSLSGPAKDFPPPPPPPPPPVSSAPPYSLAHSNSSSPFTSMSQSPAGFLASVLPATPTSPSFNALGLPKGNGTISAFPRKQSRGTPRLASDSDIQGTKDAVIQDLERKLRFKEERMSNGQQRLTYEEKMARRLLGADNAATVLNTQQQDEEPVTQDSSSSDIESVPQKEYKVSSFEQRLISEIEFRLERSPVEESDDDVQHDEDTTGTGVVPFFDSKLKHYKVFEGMPVTFSCKVIGDPKPKIYWFKDGKQISKRSEHYRISRDADGTCNLHTAAASLDDDGNYTIMAGNPEGRVSCTGRMMVQAVNQRGRSQRSTPGHIRRPRSRSRDSGDENENIQERHFRPHFLQAPGDLIVQEGRLCRMDCKVSGLPTPDLIWQLNGQTIRPDSAHKMLVRENGVHSLVIEPVSSRDAGIYTCIASNRAGQNSFNLELIVAAKEMHKAPSFIEKLQNTGVAEGYPVRLECRVSAVPYPQIFWKKENESFTHNTDRISMHQDNCGYLCMIIQPAMKEDAGWYTVSAKNEAGIVSSTARLDVHTQWQQPNTPKPKKVRPSTSRYAALTERGLDVKAAFFPDSSPLQPGGLVESDDL
ncbi:palladin isoform X3 [Oncorhynchus keta]|uniref:palladin isoform X3 n=1 Tax=Oncorhynchus keta TaxID=8018 RepID=UPI00227CA7FE|nr:palladin isoform X3 [Oncorhynchus keta]